MPSYGSVIRNGVDRSKNSGIFLFRTLSVSPTRAMRKAKGRRMSSPRAILIIEDEAQIHRVFDRYFNNYGIEIRHAYTLEQGKREYLARPGMTLIAVDGLIPRSESDAISCIQDTAYLVRKIRETFHGPMVAMSSREEYNDDLRQAGCSHSAEKVEAPKLIKTLLDG